jgi:sugar phosphate isomerase/epimerase
VPVYRGHARRRDIGARGRVRILRWFHGTTVMRTLTFGFLNCPELAPPELVTTAAQAGFGSVGIRITGRRVGDPYADVIGNRSAIDEIRARLHAHGIRLSNVSAYHLYPEVTLRELEPLVDTVAALGAETIVVSCYDPVRGRFCAMLADYADAAAARGVRIAIEFVPFSEAKTLASVQEIVATVGKPNLGLLIDGLHLARSGGSPEDLRGVPSQYFFFAQLCDAPKEKPAGVDLATEARTMRLDPGDGALPVAALLDAMPAELEVECEFPTQANLRLPPLERARSVRASAMRYLDARNRERRKDSKG